MKQNVTTLSTAENNLTLDEIEELLDEQHTSTAYDTPLRSDAFDINDDKKIDIIAHHFREIMQTLGLDLTDDSLNGTPRRVEAPAPALWHGWSPDGKTLTYCAERERNYDVYTIPVAGGPEMRLTTNPGNDNGPDFSADGRWIYFHSFRNGGVQVWRIHPDGTGEEQITFTKEWDEGRPMYLPNSETVMFRAWKYADYGKIRPTPMTVFTIRHDGTALTPRTPGPAN